MSNFELILLIGFASIGVYNTLIQIIKYETRSCK